MILKIGIVTVKLQITTYMTSQRLRHRKFVVKMTSQNFSIFKLLP